MKLAAKLMFVFLAGVMLMTAVGSYFSVRRGFARFEQRQQQMTRDAAEAMDERLAEAWQREGAEGLFETLESMPRSDSRHRVRWVWFEQTQLAGGQSRTMVVEQIRIDGNQAISQTIIGPDGRRHLRTYYPIDLGNGPRGGLELTGSLEPHDTEALETITTALVSLGVMAAVSFGLVYFVGVRWIARPLDRLIAKTERIGRGDFSQPLPEHGHDELSQLARALNAMSVKLAEQQQQIHDETTDRLATLEQLRHADRLKTVGRLAAGLAHELGTPLNVMSGRADLIASGKLSGDDVAASAQTIKSEAVRVTAIIRQLLDFARPSTSRRTQIEVGELLRQTVLLIEPLAEKRQVRLTTTLEQDAMIVADRGQMQQVFTNLLVNAAQSMADGGTVTTCVTRHRSRAPNHEDSPEADYVAVAIRDQGQGIQPGDREHIFEPFFTTKDVGEGTGLGLSIAYGIVQDHGGWIEVESEPGHGSCFTVYLPQE